MPRIFIGALTLAFSAVVGAAFSAETPNIVVILSDDLGFGSLGCYGAPPNLVRTPNIDRLAIEGRRFTDANTPSSVCSPTRYALMTGRYCWRTSLKREVLNTYAPLHIETDRLNLASLLKNHGYATAAIGKWHLGYGVAERADFTGDLSPGPLDIGFDYHFGLPSNHGDVTGVFVENREVAGLRSKKRSATPGTNFNGAKYAGLDAPQRIDDEVMGVLTDKVIGWLGQQTDETPFFLYYAPVAVHNPITPSSSAIGSSSAGAYGDFLHDLDASVGALLDVLDERGFADNTLVIFSSDNGGSGAMDEVKGIKRDTGADRSKITPQHEALLAGLDFNRPWRGRKHSVYQGGFRVPFLVRWPGHVPAGTICNEMLSLADMLATVSAVVGDELPPSNNAAEDSFNMLPAFLGQEPESPIRADMIVHSADGNFAIRQGMWKYVEGIAHPDTKPAALRTRAVEFRPQLYDLASDPGETTDLSERFPAEVARLRDLLDAYRKSSHSRP